MKFFTTTYMDLDGDHEAVQIAWDDRNGERKPTALAVGRASRPRGNSATTCLNMNVCTIEALENWCSHPSTTSSSAQSIGGGP